jgi:hypothetical protein
LKLEKSGWRGGRRHALETAILQTLGEEALRYASER